MNEINIIPSDARYVALNEIFAKNGYKSRLCTPQTVKRPDILILPIKSALTDEEFSKLFRKVKKSTLVFCGQINKVTQFFKGKIIDYSSDESFLDKNAYITAECAMSIALSKLERTVKNSSSAIIGYGRIGKYLAKMLKSMNSDVTVFARREESRKEASSIGYNAYPIQELSNNRYDVIFNTVPEPVISRETSNKIPKTALVYDLASLPGGFEDESYPERLLALPGKMMPISAAEAIFDFVEAYIINERK